MFAYVLYFNQKFNEREGQILQKTTTDLISRLGSTATTIFPTSFSIRRNSFGKRIRAWISFLRPSEFTIRTSCSPTSSTKSTANKSRNLLAISFHHCSPTACGYNMVPPGSRS
jgi:hypothetical protein